MLIGLLATMRLPFTQDQISKPIANPESMMRKLKSMSFDELLALKDDVETLIAARALAVKKQLQDKLSQIDRLTRRAPESRRQHSLKGRKLAPKYRNPQTPHETWAGRGAMPRWLKALVAKGHKPAEFAIQKAAPNQTKRAVKRGRGKSR
jgi:DNA-binding protein H-NS